MINNGSHSIIIMFPIKDWCLEPGIDYWSGDVGHAGGANALECQKKCEQHPRCDMFTKA